MIGFRVDGNAEIGMGHYMRSACIAERLRNNGETILFISSEDSETDFVENKGFLVYKLRKWNTNGWDVIETIEIIKEKGITTLFIDIYRITEYDFEILRENVRTIYIDDLNLFNCNVDAVINFNLEADEKFYKEHSIVSREVYAGIKYFPLRQEFSEKGEKEIKNNVKSILITTGSTDPIKCALKVMQALSIDNYPDVNFQVLIGLFYSKQYQEELFLKYSGKRNVEFISWGQNMADVISQNDMVISSGSTTVFEALSLNVPCITFQFADNHNIECVQLEKQGLAAWAGIYNNTENDCRTSDRLRLLFNAELKYEERLKHSFRFRKVFDGSGIDRIVQVINYVNHKKTGII